MAACTVSHFSSVVAAIVKLTLNQRFKELLRKYGKVALGVHFSVSAASIAGLYIAIKNNVDVQAVFEKVGVPGVSKGGADVDASGNTPTQPNPGIILTDDEPVVEEVKKRNRTAEMAASSGGALALAVLLNKALFPVRVPITLALTPPVARFLRARQIIKNGL